MRSQVDLLQNLYKQALTHNLTWGYLSVAAWAWAHPPPPVPLAFVLLWASSLAWTQAAFFGCPFLPMAIALGCMPGDHHQSDWRPKSLARKWSPDSFMLQSCTNDSVVGNLHPVSSWTQLSRLIKEYHASLSIGSNLEGLDETRWDEALAGTQASCNSPVSTKCVRGATWQIVLVGIERLGPKEAVPGQEGQPPA